jgi:hypothetical protein
MKAAVKGMLVAAAPTCLAAGTSNAPLTVGHAALIASSLVAAGGVALLSTPPSKKTLCSTLLGE